MNAILTGINITDKNEKAIPKKHVSIGHIPRKFFMLFNKKDDPRNEVSQEKQRRNDSYY